ncbi:aldehyde dehydrogenase family protein [Streptomyces cirratus]
MSETTTRLNVFKTYKLYVGGKFPRSESAGVRGERLEGQLAGQRPAGLRKDARDAVVAARKAFGGWAGATAYNRGQILYRIAEMLEGRREQFVREVGEAEGLSKSKAAAVVDAAIDRWVWYAGWTDKIGQVVGAANPVAGPFFNLSTPEPTGVVTVVAPQDSSFLGLVSVIAPVIDHGQHGVVIASEESRSPPSRSARCWRPPTCRAVWVNIPVRQGAAEMGPHLASHQDVNAIDLRGAARRGAGQGAGDRRGPTTSSASCVHSLWTTGPPTRARRA